MAIRRSCTRDTEMPPTDIVKLLLDVGADKEVKDIYGETPLCMVRQRRPH